MPQGACNCGAVAFAIDGDVTDVFMCHCSICRRFTGAAHIAVVVVANERFRWTRGADHVTTWTKPNADWHCAFCRTCGSALPAPNDSARMFVPAGLLGEGAAGLRVRHHIFVDSRAPWDEIGDDGTRHPDAFGSG